MITTEQINQILDKFFHEHRVAWDEIVRIEKIQNATEKTKQTLHLFNTELLPHFKQEEETILSQKEFPQYSNDTERNQILDEHQKTYTIIGELENNKNIQPNLDAFFPLMKSHIRLEDKYFGKVKSDLSVKIQEGVDNAVPLMLIAIGVVCLLLIVYGINKVNA